MRAFAHLIAPQDVWVTIACETLQCRGIKVLLKIALVVTSYSDLPRVGKINNIKKSFWILGIWYAILYIYSFSTNVWSLWQVHWKIFVSLHLLLLGSDVQEHIIKNSFVSWILQFILRLLHIAKWDSLSDYVCFNL